MKSLIGFLSGLKGRSRSGRVWGVRGTDKNVIRLVLFSTCLFRLVSFAPWFPLRVIFDWFCCDVCVVCVEEASPIRDTQRPGKPARGVLSTKRTSTTHGPQKTKRQQPRHCFSHITTRSPRSKTRTPIYEIIPRSLRVQTMRNVVRRAST